MILQETGTCVIILIYMGPPSRELSSSKDVVEHVGGFLKEETNVYKASLRGLQED